MVDKQKLDVELYETRAEVLGVDSADFITKDATYIRLQVLLRGRIKVIPNSLVENIVRLIRQYDIDTEKDL